MLENPGDLRLTYKTGGVNPYIQEAKDYASSNSTTSLAKAQVLAMLAIAFELREQRKL